MAAESSYIKNNTMGLVRLGSASNAVTLDLAYDKGDVTISNLGPKLNEHVKIERRGKFVSNAFGARVYPQVSLSMFVGNLAGSSATAPGTPLEMLTALGAYSANVSAAGTGRPVTVNVRLTIEGTNFGDTADETVTLNNVYCTMAFNEAVDGYTLAITGEVLGSVVIVNSANTVTIDQIT